MKRVLGSVLILAMIAGAIVTYQIKNDTELLTEKVARMHANIAKEREEIAMLKAEWSLLTQPSRLQALVTRYQEHFQLEPFLVSQVATLDEIPIRAEPEKEIEDPIAELSAVGAAE